jgi:tellurite resistance protein TerC
MLQFFYTNIFFFVFAIVVLSVLFIDLLFVGKDKHIISLKESLIWTSIWVSLAIGFYFFIKFYGDHIHNITNYESLKNFISIYSPGLHLPENDFSSALKVYRENAATDFITGYLLEYTLSIDNVFVILMILTSFSVSPSSYKTVLFWGILGALLLRFLFIFVGSALIIKFSWILYIFGLFLIYTGIKMFVERKTEEKIEVRDHLLVRYLSRHFSIHPEYLGANFWKKIDGKFFFTPLFIVLIMIEFTDLVFAFDSIPAIFSITRDPYIVFFSNIFAIIGLRSLFFLLIRVVNYFHFLKVGISFLLAFVGLKLLLHHYLDNLGFKNIYSLYIILATLAISILASVVFPEKKPAVD